MSKTIYTMKDWKAAGSFNAEPGQEIEADVYNEMLNCMPPKTIPSKTARIALEVYKIPVHAGFLMGEPHSTDKDGLELYLAFGMNDFGSGTRREPHYYYLGLTPAVQPIADGYYYFFDCMNAFLNKLFTESAFEGDKDAIHTAADYEAILYKYKYENGERTESKTLYDPWGCFDEE